MYCYNYNILPAVSKQIERNILCFGSIMLPYGDRLTCDNH